MERGCLRGGVGVMGAFLDGKLVGRLFGGRSLLRVRLGVCEAWCSDFKENTEIKRLESPLTRSH